MGREKAMFPHYAPPEALKYIRRYVKEHGNVVPKEDSTEAHNLRSRLLIIGEEDRQEFLGLDEAFAVSALETYVSKFGNVIPDDNTGVSRLYDLLDRAPKDATARFTNLALGVTAYFEQQYAKVTHGLKDGVQAEGIARRAVIKDKIEKLKIKFGLEKIIDAQKQKPA